jgi:thiamine-phosphate pyrophosphorylase
VSALAFPRLYVICDDDACAAAGWSLVDFAAACLEGGATLLQVRAKRLTGEKLLDATRAIVSSAAGFRARVVVNDRPDLALMAGAAGVHLGQDDVPAAEARAIVGPDRLVGLSTHTAAQFEAALAEPISYVAIGPMFKTPTKDTGYEPVGLERLRAAGRRAHQRGLPLVAIGGITLERAPAVLEAGATSVAVISDLLAGADPTSRVRQFVRALA